MDERVALLCEDACVVARVDSREDQKIAFFILLQRLRFGDVLQV